MKEIKPIKGTGSGIVDVGAGARAGSEYQPPAPHGTIPPNPEAEDEDEGEGATEAAQALPQALPEELPNDFGESLKLLKAVNDLPENTTARAKSKAAQLERIQPHVFALQQGLPVIHNAVPDYRKQEKHFKISVLNALAQQHPILNEFTEVMNGMQNDLRTVTRERNDLRAEVTMLKDKLAKLTPPA